MPRVRRLAIAAVTVASVACGGGTVTTTVAPTTTAAPGTTVVTTPPTSAVITLPPPETPLVVWVEDADLAAAVEARGEAFTAARGIAVEVRVFTPDGSGPATLLEALLADSLDGAADIYLGEHTWLAPLAEAGLAEPIGVGEGIPAAIAAAVAPRGYGLAAPLTVDGVVQVRNRALMPEAPAAVESIPCPDADRCLLLPADGDADLHYPFLVAQGGYLLGLDPAIGYDVDDIGVANAEAVAGVNVFAELLATGVVDAHPDVAAAIADFAAGNAALIWVRSSDLAAVQASGMDLSVENLPTIGGNAPITTFRVLAAFVNPFGAAKSEAVEFASDWLGDPGGSAALAAATGTAPVWPEAAGGSAAVVLEVAAAGHPVPPVADIDRIWFELSDAFRRIHAGTPVADALSGARDDIQL